MFQVTKWRWLLMGACVVGVVVLAGGFIAWRASHVLKVSQQELRAEREIKFIVRPYLSPVNDDFETVRSPQIYSQVARFQDHLYIAGPAGLTEHDLGGALLREFQAGRELPGSPLIAMTVTQLADATHPELLLATADQGILAFDGHSFRQIYPSDADVRSVTAILPVSAGRLLIGTKKRGVLLYDGHIIQELHSTLGHLYIQALGGTDTDLWVGTLDQGVKHWHGGTTETFAEEQGLPDRQAQSILVAGNKTYVGTPVGVAEFDQGRFSRVLAEGTIVASLLVHGDELWVGSQDQGVLRVPLAPRRNRAASRILGGVSEPEEVRQLVESNDGVLVLTRKNLIMVKSNASGWKEELEPSRAVLTDRNISALAVDKNKQVWVGYFDRGVDVLANGPGGTTHVENDRVFCVNRIFPDPNGQTVEVATANGLIRFDASGKPRQVLGKRDGLIADHVTDVAPYGNGLAIATPAGITFLDSEGARSMYAFHGLVNNHVYALGTSGDGLMVGTLGGLSSLEKGFVKANYTAGNSGLKQNWITAVVRVGDEWMVGTYGSGVMGLDDAGKFHAYQTATAPVEINPNAMLVTEFHVFAGTLGNGLFVYDRARARWSPITEGLPSQNVTAFTESNGYIYVGTDNGLVRIKERKLQP